MTSAVSRVGRVRSSVGEALTASFLAIGANLGPMAALALIIVGVPNLLVRLFSLNTHYRLAGVGSFSAALPMPFQVLIATHFITGIFLEAVFARLILSYLSRRTFRIAKSLMAVADHFLPVLGIALLNALTVLVSAAAVLAPGIYVLSILPLPLPKGLNPAWVISPFALIPVAFVSVIWCAAIPSEVVESRGVIGSLGRSLELTKGRRWAILGVLLVLAALNLGLDYVGRALTSPAAMLFTFRGVYNGALWMMATGPINAVVTSLVALFGATTRVAIYAVLRRSKEGVTPETLTSVFE